MCRLNVWPWVDDALEDYRQRRVNDQDFAGGLVLLSLARSHRSQVYVMFLLFRVTILVPTHGRKPWNCFSVICENSVISMKYVWILLGGDC